ncbi:hypothetical protein [Bdellovibrio sp. HCB2-146]|uniref:hypothetical protein n=1 Tax=Bdellovibrio sp. HCB2-146 TaxID=3394362 RepID=UPI0039BC47E9
MKNLIFFALLIPSIVLAQTSDVVIKSVGKKSITSASSAKASSGVIIGSGADGVQDPLIFTADCTQNKNDNYFFEIFIPSMYDSSRTQLTVGVQLRIDERVYTTQNVSVFSDESESKLIASNKAVISAISKGGMQIKIKLQDGRILNFDQRGGRNIRLGNETYMCSNPIGF